jgi:hypothetical protein
VKKKRHIFRRILLSLLAIIAVGMLLAVSGLFYCKAMYVTDSGKINHTLRTKYFNDKNDVQLPAAKRLGVSFVANDAEFETVKKSLTRVRSSRGCFVFPFAIGAYRLRPYLTADAAALLRKIGSDFADSLQHRGIARHEIVVTSIFRTQEDVKRLQKSNSNAITNSMYQYGTIFDISWRHFVKYNAFAPSPDSQVLQDVLAHTLAALKTKGYCHIIQEQRQTCYHITVREKTQ